MTPPFLNFGHSPPDARKGGVGRSLFILTGPTASGKTAVACEIARRLPVETISFDSMQVYRGMPILTQAPTAAQRKRLRAHLVSFLEPSRMYDAARFRKDALTLIEEIEKRGRTPLLCGGTGLYLRMLLDGLFETDEPMHDAAFRKKLMEQEKALGPGTLHEKLKREDPPSALKIHPNDLRRLVRALEVLHLTGKPLSQRKTERRGIRGDFHCPILFLDRDRADLYARIEERVDRMLKDGLVREAKRMLKKRLSLTASGALGLKEMKAWMAGECSFEEAVKLLKQHTRNYAKRQVSWFRHEKGVHLLPVAAQEKPAVTAKRAIAAWEALR